MSPVLSRERGERGGRGEREGREGGKDTNSWCETEGKKRFR